MSNVSMIDGHIDRYKEMTSKEIIDGFCYCLNNSVCDGCVLKGEICDASLPNKIEVLKMVSKVLCSQQAEIERLSNSAKQWEDTAKDLLISKEKQQAENKRLGKEVNLVSIQFQDLQERYEEAQAEVERLQNESIGNCELAISMRNDNNLKGDCSYCIDKAKAEAIKEFARGLRQQAFDRLYVSIDEIDNLVKEMVGTTNE